MPLELARLTAAQVRALSREQTVFFFPVGPLEDHGPHLPLGLDLVEATELCRLAALRLETELPGWTGVLAPGLSLGVDSDTTELRVVVRGHVLRDWLVDACRSLSRAGFLHYACFSGHLGPRQLTAIEEAGRSISRSGVWSWALRGRFPRAVRRPRPTLISACSPLVRAADVSRAAFWPDPAEHGGRRDTSVALAMAGGVSVDPAWTALPSAERAASSWARLLARARGTLGGYWGSPAEASLEQGTRVLSGTLDQVFPKMRAVWEGSDPNALFRSWYSVLPPNRSFFKAWLFALVIVIVMGAWVWLSVTTMIGR
jgi:creatinine amidohydrolase/Fe(II)-dependent formamide hydrolase-like protein